MGTRRRLREVRAREVGSVEGGGRGGGGVGGGGGFIDKQRLNVGR